MTVTELSTWIVTSIVSQIPGQRLVDRVVDDLVNQMVQPDRARRPDVHRRALAHGLEAFEHLDLVGAVVVGLRNGQILTVPARLDGGSGADRLRRNVESRDRCPGLYLD